MSTTKEEKITFGVRGKRGKASLYRPHDDLEDARRHVRFCKSVDKMNGEKWRYQIIERTTTVTERVVE